MALTLNGNIEENISPTDVYLIKGATLTNIAEPLRMVTGITDKLTPIEIAEECETVTEEIQLHKELVAQIKAALIGKSSGNINNEAWTFELTDGSIITNVSTITIPEGEVQRILQGTNIIWEKPDPDALPVGYTIVDYISFTGEQTVDTGILIDKDTIIETTFTRETSDAMYLYGVRSTNNTASVTAYLTSSGAWRFGNTYKNLSPAVQSAPHTVIQNSSGVKLNGTLNKYGTTVATFTTSATLTLGSARTTSGGYGSPSYIGKISAFKISKNDVTILEYIPCKNADGVYGFWDKINRTFKTSITETALQGA